MARITTKEYIASRQIKNNGDCISGDELGGTVFFCVMALIRKKLIIIGHSPPSMKAACSQVRKILNEEWLRHISGLHQACHFFFTKVFSLSKDCSKTAYNSLTNCKLLNLFLHDPDHSATAVNTIR